MVNLITITNQLLRLINKSRPEFIRPSYSDNKPLPENRFELMDSQAHAHPDTQTQTVMKT